MLTGWEKILFLVILLSSIFWSRATFSRMFKIIARGSDPIRWSSVVKHWWKGFSVFISQRTLFKTRPILGGVHAAVAWGFTVYMLVNLIDILYGLIPGFHFLSTPWLGDIYRGFVDIFSVLVLVGVAVFLIRRFVTGDSRLEINPPVMLSESARRGVRRDSLIVGWFIILHVGFRLLGASFEVAQHHPDWGQPAATLIAGLWSGFEGQGQLIGEHLCWWLAIGLILAFIPYFPYSKHAHLFMGPLNYMATPDRRSSATLETIDFEDDDLEQFGVSKLEHLPQTQLLDGYACIMCNRCQDMCPAYESGKELSPSALEINKRYYFNEHNVDFAGGAESASPLREWMITPEALWSCTSCAFCVEACPVGNEPMVDILRIRQDLVMMESDFPQAAMETFQKLETYGNPWGMSSEDREKWTADLDVPLMREKKEAEILYWVGCAGAYDNRGKEISRSVAKILNQADVDYAILGNEETCTGDSARRIGNEYLFQMLAEQNKETFEKYAFKKIVTQCPHCLTTLKNDYAELGINLEVMHHSQLIGQLVAEKKVSPQTYVEEKVTYHDACYLGRHNGEYDAPRDAIQQVLSGNGDMLEMERNRETSFCCGAGGGNMWYDIETGDRINVKRFEEAMNTGAETVATACSFCMIMMEDAMKLKNAEETMQVKDIAELVAGGLQT